MPLISRFDPWSSPLCTCPAKLTLNPYDGCDHGCIYCYATRYTCSDFSKCSPKKDLVQRLKREAHKVKGETVALALSSDPYPTVEAQNLATRACLETLTEQDCRIQIVTKSDLVTRDIDLLKKVPSVVSFSITTDDDELARIIEPKAPPPSKRLAAVEKVIRSGLPATVRIDPIIPFVNDMPDSLIRVLASLGVRHVTSSTYKVKSDNWKRLSHALPEAAARLKPLYFEKGERKGGNIYLPEEMRTSLMERVRSAALASRISFAVCREDLTHLNTAVCDGTGLIREKTSS